MNEVRTAVSEVLYRSSVRDWVVYGLMAIFLVLAIVLTVIEHRARMKAIREHARDVREWQGVQIAKGNVEERDGKTWYRMN